MGDDVRLVTCPYCFEPVEFWVDPGVEGQYVEDCEVCCNPWAVRVSRDHETGELSTVDVDRAQ